MDNSMDVLLHPDLLTQRYMQGYNNQAMPLTAAWWDAAPRQQVMGNDYSFLFFNAVSKPSPMNVAGGTARLLAQTRTGKRTYASCHHVFNQMVVGQDALLALESLDSEALQDKGAESIALAFDEVGERHKIAKELMIAKSISGGIVYVDNNGQVLEDSTTAVITVDLQVPANNKTNLNGLLASLWSNKTAKLCDQLDAIRRCSMQNNRERPTEIWVNSINKKHLRNNDQFVEWCLKSDRAVEEVLRGEIILDLWGWNWHFVDGTYTASDNTTKDFFPTTIATITPPITGAWCKRTDHLSVVPKQTGIMPDWKSAHGMAPKYFGPYSYAYIDHNPYQLSLFMGDKYGFVFADPGAIYIATAFTAST